MGVATANRTIGPFWHLLDDPAWAYRTRFGAGGPRIVRSGRIADGEGAAVSDACVELCQADPPADKTFPGFRRWATDAAGRFRFVTLQPGPVHGHGNLPQAPHVALTVSARGLLHGLVTRAYFQGQALNDTDPLLASIADPARRATLIATHNGPDACTLDIHLQGNHETVFLEI